MSYRWIDHTAELELELEAATERGVFEESLRALAELLVDEPPARPGKPEAFEVALTGHDRALLLADWLDELAFRAETGGLLPQAITRIDLDERGLRARVSAIRADPRPLVKGVTHHRLSFERVGEGRFRARLVLDV